MGIYATQAVDLNRVDLVLDALIGYGLTGDPRGRIADWIMQVNTAACPVLALDTPSGLNTTTGVPGHPCMRATATMTLALPKTGLIAPQAAASVGDLYLADISVPPRLYARLGFELPPIFIHEQILNINS